MQNGRLSSVYLVCPGCPVLEKQTIQKKSFADKSGENVLIGISDMVAYRVSRNE